MFIENDQAKTRIKRYSVVGNDPSFKSYTKNNAFYDEQKQEEEKQQTVLEVSLKDVEEPK